MPLEWGVGLGQGTGWEWGWAHTGCVGPHLMPLPSGLRGQLRRLCPGGREQHAGCAEGLHLHLALQCAALPPGHLTHGHLHLGAGGAGQAKSCCLSLAHIPWPLQPMGLVPRAGGSAAGLMLPGAQDVGRGSQGQALLLPLRSARAAGNPGAPCAAHGHAAPISQHSPLWGPGSRPACPGLTIPLGSGYLTPTLLPQTSVSAERLEWYLGGDDLDTSAIRHDPIPGNRMAPRARQGLRVLLVSAEPVWVCGVLGQGARPHWRHHGLEGKLPRP